MEYTRFLPLFDPSAPHFAEAHGLSATADALRCIAREIAEQRQAPRVDDAAFKPMNKEKHARAMISSSGHRSGCT
jgi:hypothetical protein